MNGFVGAEREDWVNDPRIPLAHQLPDYFYGHDGDNFDRGHLVRREDVAWGADFADMQRGNGDTFHGRPAAYGFILDQDLADMDPGVEFALPNAWKEYLRPLAEIEELLGGLAELGPLKAWDQCGS